MANKYTEMIKNVESQKTAFVAEVDKALTKFDKIESKIKSIDTIFSKRDDSVLNSVTSENNAKISKECTTFEEIAKSKKSDIVAKTDAYIAELKIKEAEEERRLAELVAKKKEALKPGQSEDATKSPKVNYVKEA